MSWQLGAFALLAIALAGGFAWYERVRPDARIVALVGTLAAFAALGRIAFAAVPNVKPTTDIVLISGYALGGGPGFAVGALAGLTSNFFFGQGPWTPWQMAAWGAVGVIGAMLASAARWRRGSAEPSIGRWPLAIVCCIVGFTFTVVQDVGEWVNYSDHSAAQLGVYVGKGLGFDAIHAAGCLAFALALGPALARSIQRFARRLQVTWVPAGAAVALVAVLLGACGLGLRGAEVARAAAGAAPRAAAGAPGSAAAYLLRAQNPDGGFGAAPGQASAELYTGWAALGLASAGYQLERIARGAHSVIAYLRSTLGSLSDPGSLERTILVLSAAGLRPSGFAGHDLVGALEREVRRDGSVSGQVNLTSFAVLALRGAGVEPANRTLAWLVRQQGADGGFSFSGAGAPSDVDDTGAALEALASDRAAGAARARSRAVRYLRRQQDRDGGFASMPGQGSNAQSTAWAVQGLIAARVQPSTLARRGRSPLEYLRSLIGADGSVAYSAGNHQTPVWVTGEALMALEGKPLPLAPVSSVARRPIDRLAALVGFATAAALAPLGLHASSAAANR